MKKVFILIVSSFFLYSLFRDMNVAKTLLLCGGIALAFAISKVPSKYIAVTKYPFICLSFTFSVLLFIYPALRGNSLIKQSALFLTFYSISLYLATTEESGKEFYKEVIALCLLLASCSYNLVATLRMELMLPLFISMMLFLFIMNRTKLAVLVAVCMLGLAALLFLKKMSLFGGPLHLQGLERYLVLGSTFLLFLLGFLGFVRQTNVTSMLTFFGLLYVSVDILMSVGFAFKGIMIYQPVAALLIVGPLIGVTLKGGGDKA